MVNIVNLATVEKQNEIKQDTAEILTKLGEASNNSPSGIVMQSPGIMKFTSWSTTSASANRTPVSVKGKGVIHDIYFFSRYFHTTGNKFFVRINVDGKVYAEALFNNTGNHSDAFIRFTNVALGVNTTYNGGWCGAFGYAVGKAPTDDIALALSRTALTSTFTTAHFPIMGIPFNDSFSIEIGNTTLTEHSFACAYQLL